MQRGATVSRGAERPIEPEVVVVYRRSTGELTDAHSEPPSLVSALLSGALLNCAFLGILRVYSICVAAGQAAFAHDLLIALGLISMAFAAIFIIGQSDYKRMLAYSSIAHAGYALIGVVAATSIGGGASSNIIQGTAAELGISSVVLYLMAYLLTNLAAFGVVTAYGRIACSDEISAYAGMSRRSPWLASPCWWPSFRSPECRLSVAL